MEGHSNKLFTSRNLVKHVDGTADRPPDPPTFPKGHILSDEEEAKVDKAEERLEKFFQEKARSKPKSFSLYQNHLLLCFKSKRQPRIPGMHWSLK